MTNSEATDGPRDEAAQPPSLETPDHVRLPEWRYLFSLVNDNKVVSLLLYGAFVLLKVLAVSHWNVATGSAILASSSVSGLILGALLSALPMGLLIAFSFLVFLWLSGHWARRYSPRQIVKESRFRGWVLSRLPILLALAVLVPAVVLLPPAPPVLACTGVACVLGAVARVASRSTYDGLPGPESMGIAVSVDPGQQPPSGRDALLINWQVLRRHRPTFYCSLALTAVLVFLGYSSLVSSVWLPHERVTCAGCRHPVIGYILAEDSGGLKILVSGSRVVQIVPLDDVIDRQVCTIAYSWPGIDATSGERTVAQVLGLRDDVPSCDSLS